MGILDAIRETSRHSCRVVVSEFAALLSSIDHEIVGDRYGGEVPRELFRKHNIRYEPSAKPKSDLYRELLPLINSRKVELLDHPKMISQFFGLDAARREAEEI